MSWLKGGPHLIEVARASLSPIESGPLVLKFATQQLTRVVNQRTKRNLPQSTSSCRKHLYQIELPVLLVPYTLIILVVYESIFQR